MPSPVTDGDDPQLLLAETDEASDARKALTRPPIPRRRWLWAGGGLLIAIPIALTLAGAFTSPPHAKSVPVGRLIYLEADEPSDHTSMLRGLRVMGPDGSSRQLLHETEPQDSDSGSREWITQPKASPDGHWLAFEKQVITLQEEKQGVENQLWVMPLTEPDPKPRMLRDLTKDKLKQFVGLTWTSDSQSVVFLEDAVAFFQPITGSHQITKKALDKVIQANATPDTSSTHHPSLSAKNGLVYMTISPRSPGLPYEISLDGNRAASVPSLTRHTIDILGPTGQTHIEARWGWSVFGKRHITALRWSPDGKYLAYSVSKPPLEDEVFYVELATGRCYQLPIRTGQAGWDWAR